MAASPPNHYGGPLSPPSLNSPMLPNSNNSRKRSSTDQAPPTQPPSLKRRKASNMSISSIGGGGGGGGGGGSSAHPLRQTSFPPEERSGNVRSPSVDAVSVVSGSVVSAATGTTTTTGKKKRGRKAKNKDAAATADGTGAAGAGGSKEATPSVVGRTPTVVSGTQGDKEALDEEDDAVNLDSFDREERTEEQKSEENRLRAMLVQSFTPQQMERYEHWRVSKLPDASVKRIINATTSQSVTANVVMAIRSVAKLFAGDIIEEARRVQADWIANTGEEQVPAGIPSPPLYPDQPPREELVGPLRPDHLRMALLRYQRENRGGGVGMQNLWHVQQQTGVENFSTRNRKKIFR